MPGLPLDFSRCMDELGILDDDEVVNDILNIRSASFTFYVGGTALARMRWLGGPAERGHMSGHMDSGWNRMTCMAARYGPAGAALARRCIIAAMERHPDKCTNKAPDSRGLSRDGVNLIYVCQ